MVSSIPVGAFIAVSAILFFIGVTGVLIRRNAVVILMCVELMLNATNLALVAAEPLLARLQSSSRLTSTIAPIIAASSSTEATSNGNA